MPCVNTEPKAGTSFNFGLEAYQFVSRYSYFKQDFNVC